MINEIKWAEPIRNKILECANEIGVETYFVGGIVRDSIIGRPNYDMDICVVGHPSSDVARRLISGLPSNTRKMIEGDLRRSSMNEDLEKFLSTSGGAIALAISILIRHGGENIETHASFLTSSITIDGMVVEFTGARKEIYDSKSRNPISVTPTDLKTDVLRRDFTMNSLYVALSNWEMVDPTGVGVLDIERKILRSVRSKKVVFTEDPLRILRAIRFASDLRFDIERNTMRMIKKAMTDDVIKLLSSESMKPVIREEISKMFTGKNPRKAIRMMLSTGLIKILFPEVQKMKDMDDIGHKNVWEHTLTVVGNASHVPDDVIAACEEIGEDVLPLTRLRVILSALFHDTGKPLTRRYKFSRCEKCNAKTRPLKNPSKVCKCGNLMNFSDITFSGHQIVSGDLASKALTRLGFGKQMIEWVSEDCLLHRLDTSFLEDGEIVVPEENDDRHIPSRRIPIERLIHKFSSSKGRYDPKWANVNELVRWHILASDTSSKNKVIVDLVAYFRGKAAEIQMLRKKESEAIRENKPLISGDELQIIFGLGPGKWIGEIHRRMKQDRLENPEAHDRDRAMEIAKIVMNETK